MNINTIGQMVTFIYWNLFFLILEMFLLVSIKYLRGREEKEQTMKFYSFENYIKLRIFFSLFKYALRELLHGGEI